MKTSLELAIELDALLKRSKPFRNFQEVFTLTEQLINNLTPNEPEAKQPKDVVETPTVEETPVVEDVVIETPVVITTKKTTKK